ncbi:AEC family transporter [Echinicola strongylocentroti]|uniref:AEC family transporter n=1 Tax=Echinicola strongylocentroti TaxID=1795355 RepID=A0A2Z4IJQ8_9BACT|nr:AEC family transporter [Echinicola strongylocentroti]AWW30957.1 AEC family transporter [Echinicola strongylocentroti]
MTNLVLVILCLIIGVLLQKVKEMPDDAPKALNTYLIYIVLPALALLHIPETQLSLGLLLPVLTAWISFGLSWVVFGTLGKKLGWSKATTGCLIIVPGLANTSFIGFPIIEALYGSEGLKIALLVDQAGSFIIVSSIAIIVASIYGQGKKRKRDVTKKILTFPPFIFFLIAIGMNIFHVQLSGMPQEILEAFAATLTPIALIGVGLQVKINSSTLSSIHLWYGLGYKLLVIPVLIFFAYRLVLSPDNILYKVSVMETAMAPMITGSIIAINNNLNPKLASLLVGIGIPISFGTLIGWYYLVG